MTRVIAIDGPAASGKSSTAAAVATRLGWQHLDSGALYRAVTWLALEGRITDPALIVSEASARQLRLAHGAPTMDVTVDGATVDEQIRTAEVNAGVSRIAAMPEVRALVNALQLATVARVGAVVVDGRDIGTVVFPDACLKVFLDARPEVRARRRLAQRGGAIDPAELAAETARLAERDRRDSTRPVAPLRPAPDAERLDTSELTFDAQVAWIVERARGSRRCAGRD